MKTCIVRWERPVDVERSRVAWDRTDWVRHRRLGLGIAIASVQSIAGRQHLDETRRAAIETRECRRQDVARLPPWIANCSTFPKAGIEVTGDYDALVGKAKPDRQVSGLPGVHHDDKVCASQNVAVEEFGQVTGQVHVSLEGNGSAIVGNGPRRTDEARRQDLHVRK